MLKDIIVLSLLFQGLYCKTNSAWQNNNDVVSKAIDYVQKLENIKLEASDIQTVFDVDYCPSYLLIELKPQGYLLCSSENGVPVQYDLSSTIQTEKDDKKIMIYAGPFNYYYLTNEEFDVKKISFSKEFVLHNRKMITSINEQSLYSSRASWQNTVLNERVRRYSGCNNDISNYMWINNVSNYPSPYPSNGICGTISSAALLAYYDDYINDAYIPDTVRTRHNKKPQTLITKLYNYIDYGLNGTFPYNVESGIDSFISAYSTSSLIGDSIYGWGSGGNTLRNKIQNLRPVCVSTLAEPQYGNHWVLVYDYIDYSSISYYKIVDNHGNYSTTIGTGWVSSYVYINN